MSCLVLSCQFEQLENDSNSLSINAKDATVISGRFFFTSKETLKKAIEELKLMDTKLLEDKFEKLYQKGFRSHTPIVNPNNENLLSKLDSEFRTKYQFNEKNALAKSSEIESEDNTIGDPFFGSVVNQDNEIIVGDSLYKITKDLGVIFVHLKDTTHLYEYLKNSPSSTSNKSKQTNKNSLDICQIRNEYPGITTLDKQISSYIAPMDGEDCNTSSQIVAETPSISYLSEEQILQNEITKLPICSGERTSWFQSLFGTNLSCINYFDSKHRIKTEFWNQSWLIYKSVGTQVRTQVKKVWVWWASDSEKLYMGINRIYLKYKYPDPEINSQGYLNTYYSKQEVPVYMYKGEFKILQDYYGNYIYPTFIKANSSLPFFSFGKKTTDILNIYIRKLPKLENYDIRSESNIKELYKLGINFLRSNLNSGADNQDFVVTYQKNQSEVEVIYFGGRYKGTNTNMVAKVFYRDAEFVLSSTYNPYGGSPNGSTGNPNGSFNFSIKQPTHSNFREYTDYQLDFFGIGLRGGKWSGNRMVRND